MARGASGADRLYWYQDGSLVTSAAPGETRFAPLVPGAHRLVVVDSLGRSDAIAYSVEAPGAP